MTVLHSGNYKEDEHATPLENVTINLIADLGKAATYASLIKAGAASADCILVTPPPHGGDNESDAQVWPLPRQSACVHACMHLVIIVL